MSKVGKFLDRVNKGEVEKRKAKERQQEKLMEIAADAGVTYATRGTNKIAQGAPKKAKGGTMKKDDKFIQKAVAEMEKKGTKGAFTKKANRRDMSVKQFTKEVLDNPSKYDLKTRRQAQFVANVTKYEWGGKVDTGVGVSDTLNKAYEYAKGGKIGVGAYILRLYDDAYDKVIENGYDSMQEYLDDLDKRGIGYAELDEGYGDEEDAIYTHSEEVVDELSNDGIAYQTYSSRFAKGGEITKTGNKGAAKWEMKITDEDGNTSSVYAERKSDLLNYKKMYLEKGGSMKKQGYDDKLDESVSMRKGKESSMKQSFKDRRDESKGMEKAMGRRAYASVGTMDKMRRMMAEGGELKKYEIFSKGRTGRYLVSGVPKSSPNSKPNFYGSLENKSDLKKAVQIATKDFKDLTGKDYEVFVTDNIEDRRVLAHGGQLDSVSGTKKHFGISESKWSKMSAAKKKELRKLSHDDLEAGRKYRQGYNDKLDESLGNRKGKESTKKQSLKDRRDESKGEEKALGRRAYSSVSTMDKLLPFLSWHKK